MSSTDLQRDSGSARVRDLRLGLDWDGTVSCYAPELALLAALAARVVVITVNDEITPALASRQLGIAEERIEVCICADARLDDYGTWKAEVCQALAIDLMIDDDPTVTAACWAAGVPALLVVERSLAQTGELVARRRPRS